jgi:hypothetical protein
MTDQEQSQHDQPTESGELEPEGEGGHRPGVGEHRGTAEGGGLDAEDQTGKGYGQDEGEREQALEQ